MTTPTGRHAAPIKLASNVPADLLPKLGADATPAQQVRDENGDDGGDGDDDDDDGDGDDDDKQYQARSSRGMRGARGYEPAAAKSTSPRTAAKRSDPPNEGTNVIHESNNDYLPNCPAMICRTAVS